MDSSQKAHAIQYRTKVLFNAYRKQRRDMDAWTQFWASKGLTYQSADSFETEQFDYEHADGERYIKTELDAIAELKTK